MSNPNGPQPGGTSDGYDDLSDNPNPFSGGNKWANVDVPPDPGGDFGARTGMAGNPSLPTVPGYYFNPPADGANPYHHELPTWRQGEAALGSEVANGLEAASERTLGHGVAPDDASPTKADYYEDEAMGRDGLGRSV